MFETECRLYAFLGGYAEKLTRDLDDSWMTERPAPGMNHPAWILGHLAISADLGLRILGQPTLRSAKWMRLFGPGSKAVEERGVYPARDTLREAYEAGRRALLAAAPGADPAAMSQPHELELAFLKEALPTCGLLIAHLLTTHEATHLGQLSAWRRGMGLPGVLRL